MVIVNTVVPPAVLAVFLFVRGVVCVLGRFSSTVINLIEIGNESSIFFVYKQFFSFHSHHFSIVSDRWFNFLRQAVWNMDFFAYRLLCPWFTFVAGRLLISTLKNGIMREQRYMYIFGILLWRYNTQSMPICNFSEIATSQNTSTLILFRSLQYHQTSVYFISSAVCKKMSRRPLHFLFTLLPGIKNQTLLFNTECGR